MAGCGADEAYPAAVADADLAYGMLAEGIRGVGAGSGTGTGTGSSAGIGAEAEESP